MKVKSEELMWTASNIVDFAGVIAWPVASIILVLILRSKVSGYIGSFLNRNNVTELSAAGFTAKFSQLSQASINPEDKQESITSSPKVVEGSAEFLERLSQDETKTSKRILENIKNHIRSLDLTGDQAIEALEKDLSLNIAKLYFVDINRILYRSQYDLLKWLKESSGKLPESQISDYYENIRSKFPMFYGHVDLISYLAYPMQVGLIEKRDGSYRLTEYGDSYVTFMDRNSNLIMGLVQN